MTMQARAPAQRPLRRGSIFGLLAPIAAGVALLAAAAIYLLQPRWSAPVAEAATPPLPIVVAGVVFNVPAAAVRVAMQRRAGPQERIDLAYRWPELTPPDAHAAASVFVTIDTPQSALSPIERLKTIYPRYIDVQPAQDPSGLTTAPFADGTPYQGEDVMYDASAPERFLVRC